MNKVMKNKYLVSVIMPVYNVYDYVENSILSLINQTLDFKQNIELILINDGSSDNSEKICKKYLELYPDNIKYLYQENQGSNIARNNGIKLATGKYICFLDSDDTLNTIALEKLTNFFDDNYNNVDLVEYKIIPIKNGKRSKKLHYRYNYLTKTGVYDLTKNENIYCNVTTINYIVKNLGEKTCLFDNDLKAHEDQKYSIDVIRDKMKIGYVDEAEYLYFQRSNSITNSLFYAYYLFDKTTRFWEEVFNSFEGEVPRYFQALFLNDVIWKNKKDILKPYQYEGKKYEQEYGKILKLINKCDDYVIINHPLLDIYRVLYYLNLKENSKLNFNINNKTNKIEILNNSEVIYEMSNVEVHVLTMKHINNNIKIKAYLKSPIFVLSKKPELYLSNTNLDNKIELINSSFDYLNGKEKVIKTYLFDINLVASDVSKIKFKLKIDGLEIDIKLFFESKTIFNDKLSRYEYCSSGYKYKTDGNSIYVSKVNKKEIRKINRNVELKYFINDRKRWFFRFLVKLFYTKKKVWIYCDDKGIKLGNSFYQFIHDLEKKDGIRRYYVTSINKKKINELFNKKQRKFLISFNSIKHKLYYLYADKIITSTVHLESMSPFTKKSFSNYIDISKTPEIVYLPNEISQAHMPWKYSIDRLLIDKEVVSTSFEINNLINNYSFTKSDLIESGMPRYDYINNNSKEKNIIFYAPSYRSYLVGKQGENWVSNDEAFLKSNFYKKTQEFLNSSRLKEMLKKYNYTLEFRLDSIFKKYEHFYKVDNNVVFETNNYNIDDYKIFITDYSSLVYDFVYQKKAIIYFFPDYDLFKAGLNIYRELDLPLEKGFGELCETSEALLNRLEFILKNNGNDEEKYKSRSNNFFLYYDNNQCDRIYEELSKNE